jgi:hypothetical protein
MKKYIFIVLLSVFVNFTRAQDNPINSITKEITVLPWLDKAVTDAQNVRGGLHVYNDLADLKANLKLQKIHTGMYISFKSDDSANKIYKGTYTVLSKPDEIVNFSSENLERISFISANSTSDLLAYSNVNDGTLALIENEKLYIYVKNINTWVLLASVIPSNTAADANNYDFVDNNGHKHKQFFFKNKVYMTYNSYSDFTAYTNSMEERNTTKRCEDLFPGWKTPTLSNDDLRELVFNEDGIISSGAELEAAITTLHSRWGFGVSGKQTFNARSQNIIWDNRQGMVVMSHAGNTALNLSPIAYNGFNESNWWDDQPSHYYFYNISNTSAISRFLSFCVKGASHVADNKSRGGVLVVEKQEDLLSIPSPRSGTLAFSEDTDDLFVYSSTKGWTIFAKGGVPLNDIVYADPSGNMHRKFQYNGKWYITYNSYSNPTAYPARAFDRKGVNGKRCQDLFPGWTNPDLSYLDLAELTFGVRSTDKSDWASGSDVKGGISTLYNRWRFGSKDGDVFNPIIQGIGDNAKRIYVFSGNTSGISLEHSSDFSTADWDLHGLNNFISHIDLFSYTASENILSFCVEE